MLSNEGKYFRILLDCQASPDRLDLEGETPVHIAVRNNDLETLRYLMSAKVKYMRVGVTTLLVARYEEKNARIILIN